MIDKRSKCDGSDNQAQAVYCEGTTREFAAEGKLMNAAHDVGLGPIAELAAEIFRLRRENEALRVWKNHMEVEIRAVKAELYDWQKNGVRGDRI